jgi:hypothetical protein
VLALLVLVGVALRVVALAAWWPVSTTLADSWPYAYFAANDAFANPQHPAGYSMFLRIGGVLTREVAAFTIVQHLLAVAAAVVLFAAVRRLCGSPWPGLVGAAVILLGADQIYLEHTIMSEALFVPMLAMSIYAVARAFEAPDRWWPWPVIAAALLVATAITRSAGIFMLPVVALAFVLVRPRPWLPRWRPVVAFAATACALVLSYASINAISHDRFELAPTTGWHLYARVAPFAWCGDFDAPKGTAPLCERSSPDQRPGADWYLYDARSPASRLFGPIGMTGGKGDAELGEFARAAVLHQPKTYLEAVWPDIRGYFFPDTYHWAPGRGTDLDGQLDWTGPVHAEGEAATERGMESFFEPFSVRRDAGPLGFLHDYQRTFRFGGTLLTISTLLILCGLLVGSRRNRIAVLVLGVGGLAMFVLPTFSIIYVARYSIPSAGMITAAAAIAVLSLVSAARGVRAPRRRSAPDRHPPEGAEQAAAR